MSRSDDQRLDDIREACADIAQLTERGQASMTSDIAVRYALERLLEIVGEASSALSDGCRAEFPSIAWRDITRLRILLAHHYHRTDPGQVWSIAIHEIPVLASALSHS